MNLFGGKLTSGIFAVIGGIIAVILIGIMAGPFGSLVAYFKDSAEGPSGERFMRVYAQVTGDTIPNQYQINTNTNRAGGGGVLLTGSTRGGTVTIATTSAANLGLAATSAGTADAAILYNEQGNPVNVVVASATSSTTITGVTLKTGSSGYQWQKPPEAFGKLNFLNQLLVTILALVAVIGLIMKVKNSYDAFQTGGVGDVTPVVMREVVTMVLALVGVYFTPTFLDIIGDTATVYTVGQFDFGFVDNILEIVFAILPTMLLVALMGMISSSQVQDKVIGYGKRAMGGMRNRMRPRRSRRRMMAT